MIDYSNIQVGEEPYFPVMSWATAGFEQTEQLPNSIFTNYIVLESEYKDDYNLLEELLAWWEFAYWEQGKFR